MYTSCNTFALLKLHIAILFLSLQNSHISTLLKYRYRYDHLNSEAVKRPRCFAEDNFLGPAPLAQSNSSKPRLPRSFHHLTAVGGRHWEQFRVAWKRYLNRYLPTAKPNAASYFTAIKCFNYFAAELS